MRRTREQRVADRAAGVRAVRDGNPADREERRTAAKAEAEAQTARIQQGGGIHGLDGASYRREKQFALTLLRKL